MILVALCSVRLVVTASAELRARGLGVSEPPEELLRVHRHEGGGARLQQPAAVGVGQGQALDFREFRRDALHEEAQEDDGVEVRPAYGDAHLGDTRQQKPAYHGSAQVHLHPEALVPLVPGVIEHDDAIGAAQAEHQQEVDHGRGDGCQHRRFLLAVAVRVGRLVLVRFIISMTQAGLGVDQTPDRSGLALGELVGEAISLEARENVGLFDTPRRRL
mmetsp:Transcript_98621/g.279306  ORF Transcript_98621/g.279306 Transcript_98621/m.279306 type:complete len:217 (+) Transcript_98621:3119-3769(+)